MIGHLTVAHLEHVLDRATAVMDPSNAPIHPHTVELSKLVIALVDAYRARERECANG